MIRGSGKPRLYNMQRKSFLEGGVLRSAGPAKSVTNRKNSKSPVVSLDFHIDFDMLLFLEKIPLLTTIPQVFRSKMKLKNKPTFMFSLPEPLVACVAVRFYAVSGAAHFPAEQSSPRRITRSSVMLPMGVLLQEKLYHLLRIGMGHSKRERFDAR